MAQVDGASASTDVDKAQLLDSFQTLKSTLQDGSQRNKEEKEKDFNDLIGSTGGPLIRAYATVFRDLKVGTRSAYESLFEKFSRDPDVRDCFDELLELEDEWDESLLNCDQRMVRNPSAVTEPKVGSRAPVDVILVDGRTEKQTTLSDFLTGENSILLVLLRHSQ
ncbi:uncharacterized protein [Apostichopus japonicus]|uniref:uncharacterized protein isoform X1 n=1 Tax=Stichopus japonicus TaxID=307972 RepID=UPI003AB482B8